MISRPATSSWRRPIAERWLATWAHDPVLVAESLRRLPEPVTARLAPPSPAPPDAVIRQVAGALLPAAAPETAPRWLRPEQVEAFRRATAAVRRYGGAVLAEPVGTGKSWIALAVATAVDQDPPVVLAPAVLVSQWHNLLRRAGVEATVVSHETVSRGRLPDLPAGMVILDEAHWFRNPSTRRYQTLAPWLIGRRGLLTTATPVVNAAADLGHQLRLFLRDDALAPAGLRSLRGLRDDRPGIHALAEVVVAGWTDAGSRPVMVRTMERPRCDRRLGRILRELDRLGLSTDPAVAALVRCTLWGAAASSPAALAAALLRYQSLLDQAADARAAGREVSREEVRRLVAGDPGQLLLWQMLPEATSGGTDLVLDDRARVAELRAGCLTLAGNPDGKARRLGDLLADQRPTVVFTTSVATVGYLRQVLGPGPVAWCTGTAAGIGAVRLPRESVLAWFSPRSPEPEPVGLSVPRVLVTTDVAAEGLDLQSAERVVHYDLPWTAIRTDQRAGRVRRLGSRHPNVREHWLLPPRLIARRLGVERILTRKRVLPDQLGVGEANRTPWRDRIATARSLAGAPACEGVAAVAAAARMDCDALACVRIEVPGGTGIAHLFVHHPRRGWRADDAAGLDLLARAATARCGVLPPPATLEALLAALAAPLREAMRRATGAAWEPGWQSWGSLVILRRLRHWARIAARARDARLLQRLDAAIRGLGRGHSAGEEILMARMAERTDASLLEHLRALPAPGPDLALPEVRLVGLVVVRG